MDIVVAQLETVEVVLLLQLVRSPVEVLVLLVLLPMELAVHCSRTRAC